MVAKAVSENIRRMFSSTLCVEIAYTAVMRVLNRKRVKKDQIFKENQESKLRLQRWLPASACFYTKLSTQKIKKLYAELAKVSGTSWEKQIPYGKFATLPGLILWLSHDGWLVKVKTIKDV